ncbi:MAG TPA: class I SAM-dependent methyltransferase [Polyangiaceae bacterium]|nr:class I SAM-dependent methyltransferase [Polyangiaceae bacterium]HMR73854.1 class I SAM-dependent methyltransferase [Polyangiaceae bacterium]
MTVEAAPCSSSGAAETCAACGGRLFLLSYRLTEHVILRCDACGLGSAFPKPTPASLKSLYASPDYFQGSAYYLDYVGHAANYRRLAQKVIARVTRHRTPPGRWFDVGAAAGFFMQEAKAAGWNVAGLEPCPEMAQHARGAGLNVDSALFEEYSLGDASQTVVTFLDSLEHFLDPRAALDKARHALEPGGLVVIHTPNVGSLAARILRARWPHLTPPEHLHYFSRTSLRLMLERAGFEMLSLDTLGHYFSLQELSRRLLKTRKPMRYLGRRSFYVDAGDLFAIAKVR